MTQPRRSEMTARRFSSNAEAEQADAEYWRGLSAGDRVLLAWELSVEQWQLASSPDERGLSRSIARVYRR